MPVTNTPNYLEPYLAASRKYGSGFGTLLWASPKTQLLRFRAILQAVDVNHKTVMDVGCGRADLLQYIFDSRRSPRSYIGVEAVEALAEAAENKRFPNCRIVRGDFVSDPTLLQANADVLIFSGSLNTMDRSAFYTSLTAGFEAANQAIVFNFLCSPLLAGASHLTWHAIEEVLDFAGRLSARFKVFDRYMRGDATVAVWKE